MDKKYWIYDHENYKANHLPWPEIIEISKNKRNDSLDAMHSGEFHDTDVDLEIDDIEIPNLLSVIEDVDTFATLTENLFEPAPYYLLNDKKEKIDVVSESEVLKLLEQNQIYPNSTLNRVMTATEYWVLDKKGFFDEINYIPHKNMMIPVPNHLKENPWGDKNPDEIYNEEDYQKLKDYFFPASVKEKLQPNDLTFHLIADYDEESDGDIIFEIYKNGVPLENETDPREQLNRRFAILEASHQLQGTSVYDDPYELSKYFT